MVKGFLESGEQGLTTQKVRRIFVIDQFLLSYSWVSERVPSIQFDFHFLMDR